MGQLSAGIALEIRNPLAAIAQANVLFAGSDAEQQQSLSQMISRQTQRIDKIISDTLSMVRNRKPIRLKFSFRPLFPGLLKKIFLTSPGKSAVIYKAAT